MIEFLRTIILFFQKNNIDYMLSGSVALSLYTVPRATRDFDFIVHIKDAINYSSIFNIIDHTSGFKADFVVLKDQPFRQNEFKRRVEISFLDTPVFVVTPEDLLISKLIWIQDFESSLQKEDIKNLLQLKNLDLSYIRSWQKELNLNTYNLF